MFTNEVTCAGVRISLPRFEALPLDPFAKTTFQLGEQRLVNLISPNFDVSPRAPPHQSSPDRFSIFCFPFRNPSISSTWP